MRIGGATRLFEKCERFQRTFSRNGVADNRLGKTSEVIRVHDTLNVRRPSTAAEVPGAGIALDCSFFCVTSVRRRLSKRYEQYIRFAKVSEVRAGDPR